MKLVALYHSREAMACMCNTFENSGFRWMRGLLVDNSYGERYGFSH